MLIRPRGRGFYGPPDERNRPCEQMPGGATGPAEGTSAQLLIAVRA